MIYLDSSALIKLWRPEVESGALRDWWGTMAEEAISSRLAITEVQRALRRLGASAEVLAAADELTASIAAMPVDPRINAAGALEAAAIRSLDAIHLASALSLGPALQALCTYDDRVTHAARAHGIETVAPGRS